MKNIIKNTNKKGFTIVELVIVIAVIAILAGVLIPTFSSIINKANDSAVTQETRAAITTLLAEKDGQIPENTYVVYKKDSTSAAKWFKYENGKLVDATEVTYEATDEVYSKSDVTKIIKDGESGLDLTSDSVAGGVLSDLSENVEIIIDKTVQTTGESTVE